MGFAWVILDASVTTGPLQPLPTDFENWMGNRITPCNLSELIGWWFKQEFQHTV